MTPSVPSSAPGAGASFDSLAAEFDFRRGVPPDVAEQVAEAVLAEIPRPRSGWLVDLGAGTGEIGRRLAAGPLPVVALDHSLSMLLRGGAEPVPTARAQADLDAPWPLPASAASVLFAARVAHRLEPRRLLAELQRVAAPGARLVLGKVHRDRENPGPRMRRELRRLLDQGGSRGRRHDEIVERLLSHLRSSGVRTDAPRTVATWPDPETPGEALARWRRKVESPEPMGSASTVVELGGRQVSRHYADSVLDRLEAWARRHWPTLTGGDGVRPARYEIIVARFPTDSDEGRR